MFSFLLFLSHSPAPKVVPVMDLHCSGSLKLGENKQNKRKNLFFFNPSIEMGKEDSDLKTVEKYMFVFLLFPFLLLLCLKCGSGSIKLHEQQEAINPKRSSVFPGRRPGKGASKTQKSIGEVLGHRQLEKWIPKICIQTNTHPRLTPKLCMFRTDPNQPSKKL